MRNNRYGTIVIFIVSFCSLACGKEELPAIEVSFPKRQNLEAFYEAGKRAGKEAIQRRAPKAPRLALVKRIDAPAHTLERKTLIASLERRETNNELINRLKRKYSITD